MKIVSRIEDAREIVKAWKTEGLTVGFVPTMGYLHEGHESLIKKAFEENDRVVVSVFINAKQFGEKEDFSTYPKDLERDSNICALSGAHMVFNPRHEAMYPDGFSSYVDMEDLTENLCGKVRESHFRGVCTVLAKLFNIIQANRTYFGKKDAQQIVVVKKMVFDLNFDVDEIKKGTLLAVAVFIGDTRLIDNFTF
jgi:pantoate--beta-alanine ligase